MSATIASTDWPDNIKITPESFQFLTVTVNLTWFLILFFMLLASTYRLAKEKLCGYAIYFWIAIFLSVNLGIAANILLLISNDVYRIALFLSQLSNISCDFGLSIIILSLKSLNNLFMLRSNSVERIWLWFNFAQVPIAVVILIFEYIYDSFDTYWNTTFLWLMQCINLGVFIYFYRTMKKDIEKANLQQETFLLLSHVMIRFMDFCVFYTLYVLFNSIGFICVIREFAAGPFNYHWYRFYLVFQLGTEPIRFFTILISIFIFQPYWYVQAIHIVKKGVDASCSNVDDINKNNSPIKDIESVSSVDHNSRTKDILYKQNSFFDSSSGSFEKHIKINSTPAALENNISPIPSMYSHSECLPKIAEGKDFISNKQPPRRRYSGYEFQTVTNHNIDSVIRKASVDSKGSTNISCTPPSMIHLSSKSAANIMTTKEKKNSSSSSRLSKNLSSISKK